MRPLLVVILFMAQASGQVVITDTGSTNRMGKTVTIGNNGHAVIEARGGSKAKMSLQTELHTRLMSDLAAAMPLDQMNVRHCAKSVSFGSRMFVTYKGVRSPDISCTGQTDAAVVALQKDVDEIMSQASAQMPSLQPRFR